MSNYGCQQHLINPDENLAAILEFLCGESAKLANCGTYYARQLYFKTGRIPGKYDLHKLFKSNVHFQAMYSHVAQQCLTTVAESFNSFIGLLKGIKEGTVEQRPKLPGYRKGGLALVTYPKADVKLQEGLLRFPLGTKVKTWFGLDAFYLPMPSNIEFKSIKELRILPRNKCFYIEYVYKQPDVAVALDKSRALGIDHGINNWLTCISNIGTSFIIDGKHLKSMNQWYNKRIATIKENKTQGFWNEKLAHITEKRNRQARDAVNKAARLVINHCLTNNIGTIVFGWNKKQKDNTDMGKLNNQKFVQIPSAKLKKRIEQLCNQYKIQFVETEESYTSKASFLDGDVLPTFCAKPEGWQSSGKRVNRGLFRTAKNILLNADANGAANILVKVAIKLGLDLSGISRVSLIAPLKVRLWTIQESPGF
ncbi:IS200/IS605 family element transposase accessory protein TnpB [Sphaerospermopsis sp. LEGE 00249]|uniref:RNA-guided endonuclease InsQ/TnpB family protein n=1 Tax=Sphaerospermopsis sp. LEGE 00249 TaxID=1380707 RepID=UPI00164CE7B8|nr:RNA-guided endonuclease TnpB family protein [Sphaerospermopsis sp. LEGE 00249]MBC5798055.1 IS200/IS605 family element transposase accessory protein TnpB [Sphaerospermopsis sp. LEGE 00249]